MTKTCGDCRKFGNVRCGHCKENYPACCAFESKLNNGDKIRQMSDKELAVFMRDAADDICNNNPSIDDLIAWLNAPAESDVEEQTDA